MIGGVQGRGRPALAVGSGNGDDLNRTSLSSTRTGGVGRRGGAEVEGPPIQRAILDALEAHYTALRAMIRDHVTHKRLPFLRFFACEQDLSHEPRDAPLPDAVA